MSRINNEMAKAPGSAGLPVVGDKSVEFYKDAIGTAARILYFCHECVRLFPCLNALLQTDICGKFMLVVKRYLMLF